MSKALRVLHGPVNIGNQPWALSRAERRLGLRSRLVVSSGNWLNFPADAVLSKDGASLWGRVLRVLFGLTAPFKYDAIHYYFARLYALPETLVLDQGWRSRLALSEVFLARLLRRRLVMTLQGCDARIAAHSQVRNAWTMCSEGRCPLVANCLSIQDRKRLAAIRHLLPLMDAIFYVNPELGHEVPDGTFLPYANVEIDAFQPQPPAVSGRPLIVHAPTNGGIKGSPYIFEALRSLQGRYDFDLEVVENRPHAEAMEIYRRADLAIDQINAGWYGGFAVEMMAMAKPVVCSIRQADLRFVPADMANELPVYDVRPEHLAEDIAAVLDRRAEWRERGLASRAFVERWHHPDRIAARMASVYAGREMLDKASPAGSAPQMKQHQFNGDIRA